MTFADDTSSDSEASVTHSGPKAKRIGEQYIAA
jgi:hypothetical protein